jgi:apolipoprotein D and lipocalin family protein
MTALRTVVVLAGFLAGCIGPIAQANAPEPLVTVPKVDLDRYLGRWYEIARYPNRFQRDCAGEVTATYAKRDDGSISVDNRCTRFDGSADQALGVARVVDPVTNARLQVRFAPDFVAWLPFVWGDYWIIDLGTDYGYAVVGEPSRNYLWILSRTPTLPEETLQGIRTRLPAAGYDPSRLVPSTATR